MPMLFPADVKIGGDRFFIPTFSSSASFPSAASSKNSLAYATDVNTVHYSDGSSWIQFAPLTADLAALEGLATTGMAVRTGTSTWATRSIAVSSSVDSDVALSIANANGVSGNPTISVSSHNATMKLSVECATTANITLSGTQTIDAIGVTAGNRVLVKNQTTGSANGIYIVAAGAWTRATDFDSSLKAENGLVVYVQQGTANGGKYFRMDNLMPTIGTTSLTFSSFGGSLPITESDITDGAILARVAGNESITGDWDFLAGGSLTVEDSMFWIADDADNTKSMQFQLSGLTTGTNRVLTVQDKNGTIAVESWKTLNFPADSGFTWGSSDVVSTIATDTLKIVAGNLITLATDAASKAFRVSVSSSVPTMSGGTTNKLAVWQSGTVISANVNFSCDNTNDRIGIGSGATSPVTRLHVAGTGGFGDSITASNAIRALNLASTDAVMRILRISANIDTAAPGVELMHRTTSDGTNNQYWDVYLKSTGFWIRDRTSADNDRLHISTAGDVGIGTTANSSYKLLVNGAIRATGAIQAYGTGNSFTGSLATPHVRMTNTTASTGDTWVIGSRDDGGLDFQCGNLSQVARFNATSGRFDLSYAFGLAGFANSASLGASQNNYNIADGGAAAVHRLTASTPINITGMVGGTAGRVVILTNIGTNTITLINESASSTAANRFTLNADLAITAKSSVILWYDTTTSRWLTAGGAGGGGGSSDAPVGAQYLTLATDATLTNERVFTAGANVNVTDGGAGSTYTVAVGTTTFGLTGIISPTGITGSVNDYAPTSLSTCSIIRQTTSAAAIISGLTGGASGRMILFFNIGTHDIEFLNESASSTAANRFALGTDFKLAPNKSIQLWYDSTSSRWRAVGVEDDASTRLNIVAKTAAHTLVIGDAGKFITIDSASNLTVTIPTNASVAFPIGTVVTIARTNTGKVNVAGSGGVTVNSADGDLYLRQRYSSATMMKTNTDTWLVVGDLTAT